MTEQFQPPPDVLVNRRWISSSTVEWVEQADKIMREHGTVFGTVPYLKRHQARWRARRLRDLMVELGLHEPWELVEHVSRHDRGWIWSLEYVGVGNGR